MHIAVVGNIGSGKTTIAHTLSRELGILPILEPNVSDNPYLIDFLQTPQVYSLHNQLFFLNVALSTIPKISAPTGSIADFSILGCAIFAEALYKQDRMSQRDVVLYKQILESLLHFLPRPSLYILVRAEVKTLQQRIIARGRPSETSLSLEYLNLLQTLHDKDLVEKWIPRLQAPILHIDTETYDIDDRQKTMELVRLVQNKLQSEG